MTWYINCDAVGSCGSEYEYAANYALIFWNTTAVPNFEEKVDVTIYPNPSKSQFTISHSANNSVITITDITGR